MNINDKFVITISREVGSGGRTIGRKLAEKLGVRFCDKNLINALVEKFKLSSGDIEMVKGQKKNWLADLLEKYTPVPHAGAIGSTGVEFSTAVTNEELFKAESEILRGLAEASSCVIAGRSGFFILKDHPNKLDIFIQSSFSNRVSRVMERQGKNAEEAEKIIRRVDEMRENYVQRYTSTSRYDSRNYDLVLNVDGLSSDEAVDIILAYIKAQGKAI
ncbi:MAG: cytidylate kinase-like family protein [Bacteroidales bacterium]|nr:cytidylate kinase-like family protein [Bacteroidales bacterium]